MQKSVTEEKFPSGIRGSYWDVLEMKKWLYNYFYPSVPKGINLKPRWSHLWWIHVDLVWKNWWTGWGKVEKYLKYKIINLNSCIPNNRYNYLSLEVRQRVIGKKSEAKSSVIFSNDGKFPVFYAKNNGIEAQIHFLLPHTSNPSIH